MVPLADITPEQPCPAPWSQSDSGTWGIPTLAQMIRDSQQFSKPKLKRLSKEALLEWFAQSERLNIARIHHHLRGPRFTDFAERIGVDRSSAFQLVKLWQYRQRILARCEDEGRYYGWETCLYWHEKPPRGTPSGSQYPSKSMAHRQPIFPPVRHALHARRLCDSRQGAVC